MRRALLLVPVFLALLAADEPRDAAVKKELKRLQGTWVLVAYEKDGKKTPAEDLKDIRVLIKGNRYFVQTGGQISEQGTFKVYPGRKPKAMDSMPTEGPRKGETVLSIYELEGDRYRECQAAPGKERPTLFSAKQGTGQTLMILKRQKTE